jgi:hypothetical protein
MMKSASDTRIPVIFGTTVKTDGVLTAALVEGDRPAPAAAFIQRFTPPSPTGHAIGCACCAPRGPAAIALATLFRARATGAAPYFRAVLINASPAGETAIRAALCEDPYAAARFRLA